MKIAANCGVNHRGVSFDVESSVAVSQNDVHVAVLNVSRGPSFESASEHLAGPDESKETRTKVQVSLLRPATAHQSPCRAGPRTDGHSRTRNSATRESIPRQSAEAVPGQWLHQLPVPGHGPQTAEARAAHRLRRRASEVWPACASLAPDFAPALRVKTFVSPCRTRIDVFAAPLPTRRVLRCA